jgi:hypothetical protein
VLVHQPLRLEELGGRADASALRPMTGSAAFDWTSLCLRATRSRCATARRPGAAPARLDPATLPCDDAPVDELDTALEQTRAHVAQLRATRDEKAAWHLARKELARDAVKTLEAELASLQADADALVGEQARVRQLMARGARRAAANVAWLAAALWMFDVDVKLGLFGAALSLVSLRVRKRT